MANLLELRNTLRSLGDFASGDTRISDTVVNREINRALRRIAMRHDWPWLQAKRDVITVDGLDEYSLPQDFLRLVTLDRPDVQLALYLRSPREIEKYRPAGPPIVYAIYGGKLVIPTLGGYTLRLRYIKQENVLTQDTDAPLIPDYWNDGIYHAALAELNKIVKAVDLAGVNEQRFGQWVKETQDNIQQSEASPRIYNRPGGFL